MTPEQRLRELIMCPLQTCKPMTPAEWQRALRRERMRVRQNIHLSGPTRNPFSRKVAA